MKTIVIFGATGKVGCYAALYLKEKGTDFMETYRMPDDEMVTIETLYKPASTEELKFGYISNADSP